MRRLIGIEREEDVPKAWNISRFLELLGKEPHRTLLVKVFDEMVRRLGVVVSDLGLRVAGDATGLRGRPERSKAKRDKGEDGDELSEPTCGRKEYVGDNGRVERVVEWFGYKLHLLVDVKHEVVLAWRITAAKEADNVALPKLLTQARRNLPDGRMKSLAYDKACDDGEIHELLDEAGIEPVIENRSLWKDEEEYILPGHDGSSNIVYDEMGTVYCYDKASNPPVRHAMQYIGHEPKRRTLKYRCPAMYAGWKCPSHARCNQGKKYGKTVRVKRDIDLRRFPPIPRATKQFESLYKGRSAVERVNARIKILCGPDDGNIAGSRRFFAMIGAVMVVYLGLATLLAAAPRYDGTLGKMRLTAIARALRAKAGLKIAT